jgi:multidrug efflux pump subunit AcrA (membrane-fusion protein)
VLTPPRLFTEGDLVRKGQPLYRIDASPYKAQVANAQAALARARAAIASTAALARAYGELVKTNAISKQNYENAQTSADQAEAEVAAQEAALRTAQIDLARTTVRAPITGRIGRSIYPTGALVTASQSEPLATDPAARSDLRRPPAIEHRAPEAASAASDRSDRPQRQRACEADPGGRHDPRGRPTGRF